MKKLAVIGTKAFSEQIIDDALQTGEYEFIGYIDDIEPVGTLINRKSVLCKVDDAEKLYKKGIFDCIFICIGYTRFDLREMYYRKVKDKIPLATIIAPSAIINPSAKIGEGVLIGTASVLGKNVIIEDNVVLMGKVLIGHEGVIKRNSFLAGNVSFAGHVTVCENCFLGLSVAIADHIIIGKNVWLAPGCVVVKNISEAGRYMSTSVKIFKID